MRDRWQGRAAIRPAIRRGIVTTLLTTWVAGLIALAVTRGQLVVRVVRDGEGLEWTMPVSEVWGIVLERLPAGVPGLPGREAFVVLLALAGVAAAYLLVATLRLPSAERGGRNAEWGPGKRGQKTGPGQARTRPGEGGE
ncbi:MAG: hypothetical protein AVDCRST_MAG88-4718 [uncultured Thermomicrobiales bacterium]|uniref:Uncharacterized protein n=1 Tax=uncultured Thermomicrobiales bacterium TaxID=1645740 RepID=A0A6J4VY27_9BACT|nr:MAG: hypothetical protein AVDCRST_MAG88-4718 [uncultured Thermomicrobiales bacterium]